jgi:putative oxidoreductase
MANGGRLGHNLGLLILRLALGGIFVYHGVNKVLQPGGVEGFVKIVESLNLPVVPAMPAAYAALVAEVGGGLLIILGVLPRLGALALAVVMAVAIYKVHLPHGFDLVGTVSEIDFAKWTVSKPAAGDQPVVKAIPHGCEYNVALLAMCLQVVFSGAGGIALLAGKRRTPKA